MEMYYLLIIFACVSIVSTATNNYRCECPTPSRINSVFSNGSFTTIGSRIGENMNGEQQVQLKELYCLEVLDKLIAREWQGYIDRISIEDIGNFSTLYKIPEFGDIYSNPESEWILKDGMAYNKLDKCYRNLVSKFVPKMDQEEIKCLNKMFPDYMAREKKAAKDLAIFEKETSREDLPFKTIFTYYEITELLFENRNIDSLDAELRAIHEDMLDFYIKTEEDKSKKIFLLEQECDWKHARLLREAKNDDERYQTFAQIVKSLVNRYLFSAFLRQWIAGTIIPEYKYALWKKTRNTMEQLILAKANEMQRQRRDPQFLCTYAAQFATEFYENQKEILFDKMKAAPLSMELKTRGKYTYVVALEKELTKRNDNRLSHVKSLVNEFRENHYCLTNFIRMVENHQRYKLAVMFTNLELPYGPSYCLIKEMSARLMNPRYCYCDGTFCEGFGLATLRADRFQLIKLPDGKYKVITNPNYRILPEDELIAMANKRIEQQKKNTWWYRHQKVPVQLTN